MPDMKPRIRLTAHDRRVRNRKYRRAVEAHANVMWRFIQDMRAAARERERVFWAIVTGQP